MLALILMLTHTYSAFLYAHVYCACEYMYICTHAQYIRVYSCFIHKYMNTYLYILTHMYNVCACACALCM